MDDQDKLYNSFLDLKHIHHMYVIQAVCMVICWYERRRHFTGRRERVRAVEVKPDVTALKNKKIRNHEKLAQVYGMDRATGETAETSSEMRKRKASKIEKESVIDIDEIDFALSPDQATLKTHELDSSSSRGNKASQSNLQSPIETSSKQKTAEKKEIHEEVILLKEALDNIADAIRTSTREFVKATQLPIAANEVWQLLVDLGVESDLMSSAYLFLIQKPNMLTALLGCPRENRKNLLFHMMKISKS